MEETYYGYVETAADVIRLFEACRVGLLPRVQKRLSEKERESIRPGSVFVWDGREAGMTRWTDGKRWSASRVEGKFFIYRELEGERGGHFTKRRVDDKTPDSNGRLHKDEGDGEFERPPYKTDGLVKKSFSITTSSGQHLHLIWYCSSTQNSHSELQRPSNDPELGRIALTKGLYPDLAMEDARDAPTAARAPVQQTPYAAPQTRQQSYDVYGRPEYIQTPSPAAITPPRTYVSPYPRMYPPGYPSGASSPYPALPYNTAAPYYGKVQLPSPRWAETQIGNPFPNDWNPISPRDLESSDKQHRKAVAQGTINGSWYSSTCAW